MLVVARTEEAKTGKLRPALFVVPTDSPGFTYTPIEMELISPERQFQVFLDDVRLPGDALVGAEDAAIAQLFAGLNPERIMGAASSVGMGRYALERAADYVKTRQVWGTPIGAHQGLSHPLAQCHIEVELAKLMMQKAATLYDNGDDAGAAAGRQHGQIRCGRSRDAIGRPGRAVHGRQRSDQGVRRCRHAGVGPAGSHCAGEPGDGAQLRGADVAGPAPVLLMDRLVDYAVEGHVARLTLNSPHNRNALSATLVNQLHQGLRDAAADPVVRAVVLGHTGNTFCAGADLSEGSATTGADPAEMAAERAREMAALLRAIVESPLPVIVAVDGHVRAGGMGLVGACDIAVAGPRSTFALTEARIGVAPAIISLTLLPKMSARAAARYYVTGETFDATTAAAIGLITMAADDVDAAVASLVADIGRASPQGLAASKALTTAAILDGFDRDAERLGAESARLFVSDEAREGMLAFLQKRPPQWASQQGSDTV